MGNARGATFKKLMSFSSSSMMSLQEVYDKILSQTDESERRDAILEMVKQIDVFFDMPLCVQEFVAKNVTINRYAHKAQIPFSNLKSE